MGVKGGYKRRKLQQKSMMYLPYFDQDLESKKRVVGILVHVWSRVIIFIYVFPVS